MIHRRIDNDTVICGRNASLVKTIHGFVMEESPPRADTASAFARSVKQLVHAAVINKLIHKRECVIEEHIVIDNLPDAGICCMDVFSTEKHRYNKQAPVLALFPALTSTKHDYAALIDSCCKNRGMAVVVLNRRGLCEKLATPGFHVMGNVTDTRRMLETLRSHPVHGGRPIFGLGFSMGGAALSLYLTRYTTPQDREVDGIIAAGYICSPIHTRDISIAAGEHSTMLCDVLKGRYVMPYLDYFNKFEFEESTKARLTQEEMDKELKRMDEIKALYNSMAATTNPFQLLRHSLELMADENPLQKEKGLLELKASIRRELLEDTPDEVDLDALVESKINAMIDTNDERIWETIKTIDASASFANVNIPFLALTTTDDFIVKMHSKSQELMMNAPNAIHVLSSGGAHCWFRRDIFDFDPESWGEKLLLRFFTHVYWTRTFSTRPLPHP